MATKFRSRTAGGSARCEITDHATMRDVKECARACRGNHFFDADTMRFFKSRVGEYAYADKRGGAYFVTSEKGPYGPRAYTVRHYSKCRINTVGEFQAYATSAQAHTAAKKLAARKPSRSRSRTR